MARDYSNYYTRRRPPNFPIFLPWSGAGYATGWAMVWDIPLGGNAAQLIYGDQTHGNFALAWILLFPIAIYVIARLHFDNTQYVDVWAERVMVRKWVWVVILFYVARLFFL